MFLHRFGNPIIPALVIIPIPQLLRPNIRTQLHRRRRTAHFVPDVRRIDVSAVVWYLAVTSAPSVAVTEYLSCAGCSRALESGDVGVDLRFASVPDEGDDAEEAGNEGEADADRDSCFGAG